MTKLLLVSHEASRTGAPRMAVEILRAAEGQFLVPPDDVEAMADAVVTLMADEAKRIQLGHAGRDRMQALYSVGVLREQLASLLAAALERGSSDGRLRVP